MKPQQRPLRILRKQALALPAAVALTLFSLPSCTTYNSRAANDAATGALIGAGAGALLSDDKLEGAAIGGALGGGAGYLYGRARD